MKAVTEFRCKLVIFMISYILPNILKLYTPLNKPFYIQYIKGISFMIFVVNGSNEYDEGISLN